MRVLIWFRNDLRLHDHAPLHQAVRSNAEVIPCYCFDPRQFGQTPFGFPKTGSFRAQFLLESVADLRQSLQAKQSNLIIRQGHPEMVVPELAQALNVDAVYFNREVTSEEVEVENHLRKALADLGIDCLRFWSSTLYHPEQLPFPIRELPEVFTQFRKRVEKSAKPKAPFPTPQTLSALPDIDPGELPQLENWGLSTPKLDSRAMIRFSGGESAALARLQDYIWEQDCLKQYKETRNGMLQPNDSTKFSPWLALGCVSPRYIHQQVKVYEQERVENNSTYWLIFELIWRDYFRFICAKHGKRVFRLSGLQGLALPWQDNRETFEKWQRGQTGFPLIDANMRELAATGFMSNRGRQNVASFLTKNLGLNWQMGAEWFESCLIDYDVCSNWGNWNYAAGVGNDARGFRFFNIVKQAKDYDPQGDYVRHWLPELKDVPGGQVQTPWQLTALEQEMFGLTVGKDYPEPMVALWQSAKVNEQIYNRVVTR
ncbi:DASH family cryptochrome [Acaryochloris marina NIES-2412]|uniref:DASH family cryptochrome n=1 Tax=Acaryochloris marina TaxID=155978 RepID=UPI00405A3DE9